MAKSRSAVVERRGGGAMKAQWYPLPLGALAIAWWGNAMVLKAFPLLLNRCSGSEQAPGLTEFLAQRAGDPISAEQKERSRRLGVRQFTDRHAADRRQKEE